MAELGSDERGVSEATGVAILIGMTIIVTATVGLNVLVVSEQDTGPPDANFSYDYVDSSSALLITHVEGDEFPAGEIIIEGPGSEVTWAAVAGMNDTELVGKGNIAQISRGNEYGNPVSQSTTIRIYHATDGNRTQLDQSPEQSKLSRSLDPGAQPLMLQTGKVRATLSPIPRASETRTTSSTSL